MKRISVNTIQRLKDDGEKITALTAYDYSTAKYVNEAGVDIILIGDSLGTVVLGYENTLEVGMDEMLIFTKAVARGAKHALVVTDMPFMSYHRDIGTAVLNAGAAVKAGARAIKLEGCSEYILTVVRRCVECGIPVMGHLGFTPQFLNTIGGYNIQGKTYENTEKMLKQAKLLEEAGAFSVVLEMVPEESAKYITENLRIPTLGIGAGRYCSGQILVSDDVFGKFTDYKPTFARKYGEMAELISRCSKDYVRDVRSGAYPSEQEVFKLSSEELNELASHKK